jgi:hypothetical protein
MSRDNWLWGAPRIHGELLPTLHPSDQFLPNWHIDCLAWHLTKITNGEIKRLIINMPPRSLKSFSVSVAYCAWLLGRSPSKRIIAASYGEDLAKKFSRDCRIIMESPWYQERSCQVNAFCLSSMAMEASPPLVTSKT